MYVEQSEKNSKNKIYKIMKIRFKNSKLNSDSLSEIFINALLVISIISVIHMIFKLNESADTKIYSSEALDQLEDKNIREKIDKEIEERFA